MIVAFVDGGDHRYSGCSQEYNMQVVCEYNHMGAIDEWAVKLICYSLIFGTKYIGYTGQKISQVKISTFHTQKFQM